MKKVYVILMALALTLVAGAQTLNVRVGSVTYQFPSAQTGEMNYTDGQTLSVQGKIFNLSEIDEMTVDETEVTDNAVSICYDGTAATVSVAGNVAQYVEAIVSGAHVSIVQSLAASSEDVEEPEEITYILSGQTTDGEFSLTGSYKCTLSLAGLSLANPSGAAINIANGKRIKISAKKNTENTLTDGTGGSQTGCIYSKGQIHLQGNGTLNVVGKTKHAIKIGDYSAIKSRTLNVT